MKYTGLFLALLIVLTGCSAGTQNQPEANASTESPHGSTVAENAQLPFPQGTYSVSSGQIEYGAYTGYESKPEGIENPPGVILIHEWWGLNQNIVDTAEKLSTHGYHVIAVDLYGGEVTENPSTASRLVSDVNQTDAITNLQAAQRYLESSGSQTVSSLGFCFGGGQSMEFATAEMNPDASIIFYGNPITNQTRLLNVDHPILGIFGENDSTIPAESVNELDTLLDNQTRHSIHTYPGANHAFANPSGDRFDESAARDAWNKTLNFLSDIQE